MKRVVEVILLSTLLGSPIAAPRAADTSTNFPTKPIRWILPFPPGGPSDAVARLIGQRLGERLKQPVLVDNRAGASGAIGMELAARAAPDGHTIVFAAPGSLVINPILYRLSFDP